MYYTTNQVQNASADFEKCLVIPSMLTDFVNTDTSVEATIGGKVTNTPPILFCHTVSKKKALCVIYFPVVKNRKLRLLCTLDDYSSFRVCGIIDLPELLPYLNHFASSSAFSHSASLKPTSTKSSPISMGRLTSIPSSARSASISSSDRSGSFSFRCFSL